LQYNRSDNSRSLIEYWINSYILTKAKLITQILKFKGKQKAHWIQEICFEGVILLARTIVAIFEVFDNAERAAYEVRDKGLRTDNISIVVKDSGNKAYYRSNNGYGQLNHLKFAENKSIPYKLSKRERIADGIITGGIFGGVIGIFIGAASMFVQTLGTVAAAGPIAGLVIGLTTGGIIGGLLDLRIPKNRRQVYENLISNGNALFSMKVDEDRIESIIEIIKENGALSVEKYWS